MGKWLAVYEMKMTLAAIYSRFATKIVDDDGIEMDDRLVFSFFFYFLCSVVMRG